MTRESVLNKIVRCPICKTAYLPEAGEICKCDRPDTYDEEPRVKDFEDVKIKSQLQPE